VSTSVVLLVGKPNCGKSLLFNRLTGFNQKVANFPGATVDVKSGRCGSLEFFDLPGIYSVKAIGFDEKVALGQIERCLLEKGNSVLVCMLDATRLKLSLMLGLQMADMAKDCGKSVVFAVNMIDEVNRNKSSIDIAGLAKELDTPVVAISARTGEGIDELLTTIKNVQQLPHATFSFIVGDKKNPFQTGLSDDRVVEYSKRARDLDKRFGVSSDVFVRNQTAMDRFFLSGTFGVAVFALTMLFLFQAIFTWASPFMDAIETMVTVSGDFVSSRMGEGMMSDFVRDAIFGGVGSFLVFVPQIFFLSFVIGALEDSGYLARASMICHKALSVFGMSGRSFIPLLTAHACAIPAIMAARSIESKRKRLITIAAIPLMSCSARLPVYGLLIAVLIPTHTVLGGIIGAQGLAFFSVFTFSIVVALAVSSILEKFTRKKKHLDSPFMIELPPYRIPSLKGLTQKGLRSSWSFLAKAGPYIFAVSVVVWLLGYFPNGGGDLQNSYLSDIGKFFEPVFTPLGLDWKYGVAIVMSFLAREVFVGTLGTMQGIEVADDNMQGLASYMKSSGFTAASGVGLLIFYAIALQCVSTVAVIKSETGSTTFATALLIGYGVLAYVLAVAGYQLALLF
jgi:ferrous iron transport protein B